MNHYPKIKFRISFRALLIDCIICLMLVSSMTLKKNCGFTCIWTETQSIQDGEMMDNNIPKRIRRKRKENDITLTIPIFEVVKYRENLPTDKI